MDNQVNYSIRLSKIAYLHLLTLLAKENESNNTNISVADVVREGLTNKYPELKELISK